MENSEINFFTEDVSLPAELNDDFKLWIQRVIAAETHELCALNYIFCSDEYLLNINKEYLDHDYYTDIITFDNSEEELMIEGDIFISVDRVTDNATSLNIPFSEELKRVMAHGVLHLCGFGDKSEDEAKLMRQKEEQVINLF